MRDTLKRYGMAFVFLFIVVVLMLLGTLGVKSFEDMLFTDAGLQKITPKGTHL